MPDASGCSVLYSVGASFFLWDCPLRLVEGFPRAVVVRSDEVHFL